MSGGTAAGGTLVTITGTGFTGATAVDFGTTKATHFTIVSSTEITAKSPAGTGVVDVTVTTPKGTSAVNRPADAFSYAPVVTKISLSQGPASGGTTVTITGTNLLHAKAVDFGKVAGKITKDTATQIVVKSPKGTGTVNVTVTAAGGASASLSVHVHHRTCRGVCADRERQDALALVRRDFRLPRGGAVSWRGLHQRRCRRCGVAHVVVGRFERDGQASLAI